MIIEKSCPRCVGDLTLVFDIDESYFSCVQCGFITYSRPSAVSAPPTPARAASRDAGHPSVPSTHARRAAPRDGGRVPRNR